MSKRAIPISPELVLVDPDLAAAARASLPEPPDCLATRPRIQGEPTPSAVAPPHVGRVEDRPRARGRRGLLRSALTAGAWLVLAGVMATPLLAFLPPARAPSLVGALPIQPPQLSTRPPQPVVEEGIKDRSGSIIRWRPVSGASFYNVILVRGSQRVDLWPTLPRVRVANSSPSNLRSTPKMSYSWFVYPGFKPSKGKVRYGPLVAHGVVAVKPGTLRPEARREP